jgi:four helix bundle protein
VWRDLSGLKIWLCIRSCVSCIWRFVSYQRNGPRDERFELTAQVRRCSNSASAQIAEKHSDRHVRNKIEGVNRARGESLETVHHLYIAMLKGYVTEDAYKLFYERYSECVSMLNGLEKTLEQQLAPADRRFPAPHMNPEP